MSGKAKMSGKAEKVEEAEMAKNGRVKVCKIAALDPLGNPRYRLQGFERLKNHVKLENNGNHTFIRLEKWFCTNKMPKYGIYFNKKLNKTMYSIERLYSSKN